MSNEPTPEPLEHPAAPEQPEDGFAEGEELLPDTAEKHHHGRFSEGQEELGEEDPEKHAERRFSEGQDHEPPGVTP